MKKVVFLLILFSVQLQAQLRLFDHYYMFAQKDFHHLNEAISYATYKDGDYQKTLSLLQSDYFKANPEPAFYINALLTFNTKGKDAAFELVKKSDFSKEKKEFLKLWTTYFSDFKDDYTILLSEFEKKYPNNLELFKLKTYLEAKENAKLFGTSPDWKANFYKKINHAIAKEKYSEADQLFFKLSKLDVKDYKEDYETAKKTRIDSLYLLWKANKQLFSHKGLNKKLTDCQTEKCLEMEDWIKKEEEKSKTNFFSPKEDIISKLITQNKNENPAMPVSELEKKWDIFFNTLKENEKDHFKALLSIYFFEKEIESGIMMKGLFSPIPFSDNFRKKYQSQLTKEQIVSQLVQLSEDPEYSNAFREGKAVLIREELNKLKKYGIDDLKVMYGLIVFSNYYGGILNKAFEEIGMRTTRPSEKQKKNSKEFLKFYDENPLYDNSKSYFEEQLTDLTTYEKLKEFLAEADQLTQKYKGSFPLHSMILKTMGEKKNLVPKENRQEYYELYFTKLVDFYDEIQSVDFLAHDLTLFYDIVLEGDEKYNYPINYDFYKLFTKDNLQKCERYLQQKSNAKPHQKNLKYFLEHLEDFKKNKL